MTNYAEKAAENLAAIRKNKPLIHNITNYVVMNLTANVLLAMGASPVMAHAENEVEEMVSFAGSLVINIGTLSDSWISSMLTAGKKATACNIPIILDPVGSGATTLRTSTAKKILSETRVSILRGNASEILSLRNSDSKTKGVDSMHSVEEAADTAKILAKELGTTLAITGPVDLVTDGNTVIRIKNGHPLLAAITGSGCSVTATVGAFSAIDNNPISAACTALAYFGIAGEKAAETANGPGSFVPALIDALYNLTPTELKERCNISA